MGQSKENKSLQTSVIPETISAIAATTTITQAAQELGITRQALYKRMDEHPEIMETINAMPEKALAILKRGSVRAAEVFVEKLEDKDKQMEAAKEVLDRVGISGKGPTIAVQNNGQLNMGLLIENYEEDKE